MAAICALLGSAGQLLFRLGSATVTLSPWTWIANTRIVGGMVLYGLSAILFVVALRHGRLSVLYPVIATSYVWVALLAHFVLREPVSPVQWVGLLLILAGVTLAIRS
ncbi:MAG TPA: EamA family transporter [Bacillota bacterium]|nr:EamA family transporter [Bacillota bacterium]